MYAKLENGRLTAAPIMLTVGDTHVWNAPAEDYAAQGWLPVEFTDAPEAPAGYFYEAGWEDTGTAVAQTWTLRELPPEEVSAEEIAEAIEEAMA